MNRLFTLLSGILCVSASTLHAADYAKINFQTSTTVTPAGYLPDDGSAYGARNGFTYGWNASNTANARERNAANSPDKRYDTFNHMQRGATFTWEIAVPNGSYTVRVVAGEPSYFDSVFAINVEGVLTVSGTPSSTTRWIEGTSTVNVSDGRLTISNGTGASNNKICFVDIASNATGNPSPSVSITTPVSGATYAAPASITINATASDSNGSVSKVEFHAGTTLLASDTSSPYSTAWNSVAAGSYSLTARATDNGGASATSGAVNVTVNGTAAPACGSASGGPTDNVVATKYGSTAYPWTGNIKWNCVFNVNDYSGSTMEARFNSARDAASANGGGVVYFPTGSYNFSQDIFLKNGVVIRGANPSTTDAKSSTYNPPSKLNFPKYNPSLSGSGTPNSTAFKQIFTTTPNTDSNIGVVNVDINRAAIDIQANPDTGTSRNILVFGVRQNNISSPDAGIPTSWQNAWQRWPNRFEGNINIQANANVLIANNRLNDAITDGWDQPNYKIKDGTNTVTLTAGSQARYDFKDVGYIITANWKGGAVWYSTPATDPSMFRTGIVVRDNYTFGTKSTAVRASGQGLLVKDNIRKDGGSSKYVWVSPAGTAKAKGPDFNRNRGWDVGGYDYIVEGNDMEVYNHIIGWTPQYRCNDGESCHDNQGTLVNGATYRNNILRGGTVIMIYRTKAINNVLITNNTVLSNGFLGNNNSSNHSVFIWADLAGGDNYQINNTKVVGNQLSQNVFFIGEGGTTGGNTLQSNTNPNNNGVIKHTCESSLGISGNSGFSVNACQ